MNKFFYEVQQKSTRKPLKHRKRYIPTSRKAGVFKALSQHSYKIRCQRFFSYELFNARKKPYHVLGSMYRTGDGSEVSLIPIRMI